MLRGRKLIDGKPEEGEQEKIEKEKEQIRENSCEGEERFADVTYKDTKRKKKEERKKKREIQGGNSHGWKKNCR